MSDRLPYDWFRESAASATVRVIIISAVLHALLLGGIIFGLNWHKQPEPKLITVSLVAAPGPMTPTPGSAGAPPPPPPPEQPSPEPAKPEPPKPEPPKPEPKPEPPKPEPKVEKPKPEPKPEKPPKPSVKEEKPKKPKPVDLKPVADPKDEPPKKTAPRTGKPVPKSKITGSEPSDNMMPSDVPISMAVGGQGPPTAMGSWPGLLQRQVYLQWVVPNGIPMNDANYLPQITVTIARDGRIIDRPAVTKASPSTALDDSCVQALVNATIPPFPDNYEEPSITLVVQFSPMGRQSMGGGAPQPSSPAF